jgi:hypothetical protein
MTSDNEQTDWENTVHSREATVEPWLLSSPSEMEGVSTLAGSPPKVTVPALEREPPGTSFFCLSKRSF